MTSLKKLTYFTLTFIIFSFLLITILFLIDVISADQLKSFIVAGSITIFNAGLGMISIKTGINKPEKMFFQRLFGGMVIRFLLTLIMVVLALLFLELNRISFIFSVLFFYIFYLTIEIIYLNLLQN